MKIAYLDCFSGISGDMFLGALIDSGVPIEVLEGAVASLGIGARLALRRVDRSGIDAAKIDVLTADGEVAELAHSGSGPAHSHGHQDPAHSLHSHGGHTHPHEDAHAQAEGHSHGHEHPHSHDEETPPHVHGRSLSEIEGIIGGAALSLDVKEVALKAFRLLGHAEAKIHSVPVESIHFHEVGAVDAIADIVATAAGCGWIGAERWLCSPLNVGGGHMHCAHGKFPVPAPATLELLRDLPVYSSGVKKELVTPTGAALLRALDVTSSTNFPAMSVKSVGYGAGSKDIPGQPNVLRLVVGEIAGTKNSSGVAANGRLGIIETTIDDATPELLSFVADRLLAAGASDVYRTPIQMKKGRTGMQLTVLCSPERAAELQRTIFVETTTLGLHYREEEKVSLAREFASVETEWGPIRIKVGLFEGKIVNHAPEFEDCRRIAEERGLPLKLVMQTATAAYLATKRVA